MPVLTKTQKERTERLAPGGIPRWIRCYDNGGPDEDGGTIDRYTVVYAKRADKRPGMASQHSYVGMSASPFHPQGFGQHGHTDNWPADYRKSDRTRNLLWPPAMGRKCHLGKRIPFSELPKDCQKVVRQDYSEMWNIKI